MYETKILLDSISPGGRRLTTWELTYPRMVHAELMTHREFSRNSVSSRAIPNEKLRQRVKDDPALPVWWGKNQAGMQAKEELSDEKTPSPIMLGDKQIGTCMMSDRSQARLVWLEARDAMLKASEDLAKIGLHKQLCNRLIEPWMFITVIVSSTSFDNWFHLRDHKDAQPEIAWVARDMHEKYLASEPQRLFPGEWHLPLIHREDRKKAAEIVGIRNDFSAALTGLLKKVSTGRVARVSYLTHDGRRDLEEDIKLHDKLIAGMSTGEPLHMSPFEHVAVCLADKNEKSGNFTGWGQYRKEFAGECFKGSV